jgi:hypothetical protein
VGRVLVLAGLVAALALAGVACGSGSEERFASDGVVAGRVIYQRCTPRRCIAITIPAWVAAPASGTPVYGHRATVPGSSGFRMSRDGRFGNAYVPVGSWSFSVPGLEQPDCRPRPSFQVRPEMSYDIVFRFDVAGRCSAQVSERPPGTGAGRGTVIVRVRDSATPAGMLGP